MDIRLRFCEILMFLALSLCCGRGYAQVADTSLINSPSITQTDSVSPVETEETLLVDEPVVKPKRRLVAALLCVALGPFGMHRLYLGTKPHVAAAYTLTLGGGIGLIPLIDLMFIIFDPNLYKYKDNNKFIMWLK